MTENQAPSRTVLLNTVAAHLSEVANLGESAGSSGHLASRSLDQVEIDLVEPCEQDGRSCFRVHYRYVIATEREFLEEPLPDDDEPVAADDEDMPLDVVPDPMWRETGSGSLLVAPDGSLL